MRSRSMSAACALGVLASPLAVLGISTQPARASLVTLPASTPAPADSPAGLADLRGPELRTSLDRHMSVKRRHARLAGYKLKRSERSEMRRELDDFTLRSIDRRTSRVRRKVRRLEKRLERKQTPAVPAHLQAIASCESGGDPAAVDPSGTYRGKYQFDLQTWQSVGGAGDPAAAPEAEQDARAATLYAQRGSAPWPTCG